MDNPASALADLAQGVQESEAIPVIAEDRFSAVAPTHDVVAGARIFDSWPPWHASLLERTWFECKENL